MPEMPRTAAPEGEKAAVSRVSKMVPWAAALAVVGLVLTLAVQLWFSPATLALFFMVAMPCSAAAIVLFVVAVYREVIRPKMEIPPVTPEKP